MVIDTDNQATLNSFIARWEVSGAGERANFQLFVLELCDLLGVPRPEPMRPDDTQNAYVFERRVRYSHSDGRIRTGRIDLYKRGRFVLEAKQGRDRQTAEGPRIPFGRCRARKGAAVRGTRGWDEAMLRARAQAEAYARGLAASEGLPPFLIVIDVGHCIELFASVVDGALHYVPFPDGEHFRIGLTDLAEPSIRSRLSAVWTDPLELDPCRQGAEGNSRSLNETPADLSRCRSIGRPAPAQSRPKLAMVARQPEDEGPHHGAVCRHSLPP